MNRDDLLRFRSEPNVAAFLRLIRQGESSQEPDAYTVMYGGGHFDDFSRHPNIVNKARGLASTAAGAYQFIYRTWVEVADQFHLPDFTPDSQDAGAIGLLIRRKALDAVREGNIREAINRCSQEWASLPGSQYGQPTQKLDKAIAVYLSYGGTLAEKADALPAPPRKETVMAPLVLPILSALSSLIPQLGTLFAKGEVAERNVAAGTIVSKAITDAVGAVNLQEAAEKIQADPQALQAAKDAVAKVWPDITEIGGGIDAARKANAPMSDGPWWKPFLTPAFMLAIFLLPMIYGVVAAALVKMPWLSEMGEGTRSMVIGAVTGLVLGSIMGFFYGTSYSSAKKDSVLYTRP